MSAKLPLYLRFYGISPWELEVLFSLIHNLFDVHEDSNVEQDEEFVTKIDITFPLEFNETFFKQFGALRWDKFKGIIKEIKRRRGGGNSFGFYLKFLGKPSILFIVDQHERRSFDAAIDKIDFILELLPYHLDPKKLPSDITQVSYQFDEMTGKWRVNAGQAEERSYQFLENEWKTI